MLKLEKFPNIIQYAVYTHPYRLCIYYANSFWESTNENANLSLGTGMGFSYCVHLIIKPKTWQFWVIRCACSATITDTIKLTHSSNQCKLDLIWSRPIQIIDLNNFGLEVRAAQSLF